MAASNLNQVYGVWGNCWLHCWAAPPTQAYVLAGRLAGTGMQSVQERAFSGAIGTKRERSNLGQHAGCRALRDSVWGTVAGSRLQWAEGRTRAQGRGMVEIVPKLARVGRGTGMGSRCMVAWAWTRCCRWGLGVGARVWAMGVC